MKSTRKSLPLFLALILTVSSLLIVESSAQSIPQPPNFTLKVVEHSYDSPSVYEVDQFTGKNITISEGVRYDWRTLDFTINNQEVSENNLYFNIRYRGSICERLD